MGFGHSILPPRDWLGGVLALQNPRTRRKKEKKHLFDNHHHQNLLYLLSPTSHIPLNNLQLSTITLIKLHTLPSTMFRSAIARSLRAASSIPRTVRPSGASFQISRSPLSAARAAQFQFSPSFTCQAIRSYSAPAGLTQSEIEGRIVDLLKNFDKVCGINFSSLYIYIYIRFRYILRTRLLTCAFDRFRIHLRYECNRWFLSMGGCGMESYAYNG